MYTSYAYSYSVMLLFVFVSLFCFFFNATSTTEIYTYLHTLSLHDALPVFVWDRAAKRHARGRTVTLKLRYADFRTITRAKSAPSPILDGTGLLAAGEAILAPLLPVEQGIRMLGVTLSKFRSEAPTSELPSLMRISCAACWRKKKITTPRQTTPT